MTQLTGQDFTLLMGAMSAIMTMFPGSRLDIQWFFQARVQKELQRIKQYYTEEHFGSPYRGALGDLTARIGLPDLSISPICVLLYLLACTDVSISPPEHVCPPLGEKRLVSAQV